MPDRINIKCMTTDEVATEVQLSNETVLRAVRRGKLPAIKVGREYRYLREDVRRWLDSLRFVVAVANEGKSA